MSPELLLPWIYNKLDLSSYFFLKNRPLIRTLNYDILQDLTNLRQKMSQTRTAHVISEPQEGAGITPGDGH